MKNKQQFYLFYDSVKLLSVIKKENTNPPKKLQGLWYNSATEFFWTRLMFCTLPLHVCVFIWGFAIIM